MSLVYIAGISKDGKRCWFTGTDTRLNQLQQLIQVPLFDDEKSKPVSLEFALEARDRWRKDFGINCHIAIERDGAFIDEDRGAPALEQDFRRAQFVSFTNGLGLIATPGNTPAGPCWFIKASDIPRFAQDGRYTVIESVSGATPIEAAQRAVDTYGQDVLFRDPAQDERDEKARQQASQQKNFTPGLRPGCR
jgi:hypothetical protein